MTVQAASRIPSGGVPRIQFERIGPGVAFEVLGQAVMPGAAIGRITERSWLISFVPSISAASTSSRGTSMKNERVIQTASGRFMPV